MILALLVGQGYVWPYCLKHPLRDTDEKDCTMHAGNGDALSREEIRTILIETHREDQILWSKWFHRSSTPDEKAGLYRYREGFDAAILNLAQRFQVPLRSSEDVAPPNPKEKKGTIISLEKIVIHPDAKGIYCLYCQEPLFRKGKRYWHCPVCDVEFRVVEETE